MTTIRVDRAVRNQLAALATAHGRSIGAELTALLDEIAWREIEAGYRRLCASESDLTDYAAEADEWTGADLEDLASGAAGEYPEYNGGV